MRKQGLAISTLISTVGSVSVRIVGMALMVYVSNKIGPEGVGIYQLAMTVYMMAYMVASAGVITAISKLIAEEMSKKKDNCAKKIMHLFLLTTLIVSLMITFLVYINAEWISISFIKDTRIVVGLKILTLSIPFMTISACFKGYFYAVKKVSRPASSDVFEQIIKLMLIITFLEAVPKEDLSLACAMIGLGITLGEIISFSYMFILYIFDGDRRYMRYGKRQEKVLSRIFAILIPITASSYLTAMFVLLENVLIPRGFRQSGLDVTASLSMYGLIKGMVFPLIIFPTALLSACSTVLTPEISRCNALGYKQRINTIIGKVFHFTMILSMAVVGGCTMFGEELGVLIYNNLDAGKYLIILVVAVPFIYVEIVVDGILKGLGEQKSCLKYRVIDAIFRIVLIYTLIPRGGISAYLFITIISNVFSCSLNLGRLLYVSKIRICFNKWLFYPVLSSIAAAMVSKVGVMYLLPSGTSNTIVTVIGVGGMIILYMTFLSMLQCVTKEDLLVGRNI